MSWFDATGLANIAKSALKEAQKTIDRALDIQGGATTSTSTSNIEETEQNEEIIVNTPPTFSSHNMPPAEQQENQGSIKELDASSLKGNNSANDSSTGSSSTACTKSTNNSLVNIELSDFPSPMKTTVFPLEERPLVDIEQDDECETTLDSAVNLTPSTETLIDTSATSNCIIDTDVAVMTEKQSIDDITLLGQCRDDCSPQSLDSLVKIGGSQSGHTSGDEIETTTSSDIEIIPSPNGGESTSSTQSRRKHHVVSKSVDLSSKILLYTSSSSGAPITMKQTTKTHTREPSEASSLSDDFVNCSTEMDRLLKRLTEMTECLEARDVKLTDLQRQHNEVSATNSELLRHTSLMESRLQLAIREKDDLHRQLSVCKKEAATRLTKNEVDAELSERDSLISELRLEGEKLAKQNLHLSNIIKKLRTQEKTHETTEKNLRETNESLLTENKRLKRSINSKEETERTQTDKLHQISSKLKKTETERNRLASDFDDVSAKYKTIQHSMETLKIELNDKNKASSELVIRDQLVANLSDSKRRADIRNEQLTLEVSNLRAQLQHAEHNYVRKEQQIRQENTNLLRRLNELEANSEELSNKAMDVSKPLMQQLQQLQSTYNMRCKHFEHTELDLNRKIDELHNQRLLYKKSEQESTDLCVALKSKVQELEEALCKSVNSSEIYSVQLEQEKHQNALTQQSLTHELDETKTIIQNQQIRISELTNEVTHLKQSIEHQKKLEKEEMNNRLVEKNSSTFRAASNSSPTLSTSKNSADAESTNDLFWSQDDQMDGTASRYTNIFEIQMLQSSVKQRDGELQQLHWELNRRELERSTLNVEISSLLSKIEGLETETNNYEKLQQEFQQIKQQYDVLCQLYGEKVEENEELKLDLQDVKDMYKKQLEELLKYKQAI